MYTPRSFRRSTAYQRVVASFVPWILCQGRGGGSTPFVIPDSTS